MNSFDAAAPASRRSRSRGRTSRTLTAIAASIALVLTSALAAPAAAIADTIEPTEVVAPATAELVGELVVGGSVSVETSAWTPEDAELTYEWWQSPEAYQAPVEGADPNPDAAIIDGEAGATLALGAALEGRFVWVVVTGSAAELTSASIVAASDAAVALPVLTDVPAVSITGTPVVGAPITATLAAPLAEGVEVAYQWRRGGTAIDGADAAEYTPVADDALATLDVVATFTSEGFAPTTRESAGVVVAKATFTGAPTATLSGAVRVGSPVTAVTGTWPEGTTFAYSWRIVDSKGAEIVSSTTTQVYTPGSSILGRKLSVVITGTVPGHNPVSKRSASATIGAGVFTAAPSPKISGDAYVGATLKVSLGTWTPTPSFRYQWKRNGVSISRATGSSYRLTSSDYGKKITVTVAAVRSGFPTTVRTSSSTATVTKPFTTKTAPKISGVAKTGFTLTAVAGTWSPTPSYYYQWKRDGVPISGATGKTYTLKSTDLGKRISVTVTYKRSGYFTRVLTTPETAVVTETVLTTDGWFTVGSTIAPGTYVATGGDDCYFERRTNKTLGSSTGLLGFQIWWDGEYGGQKVVTITSSDKYFYTEFCGTWRPVATALKTEVGDGTWIVGRDMQIGEWQAIGPFDEDGCYIAGLRSFTGKPTTDILGEGMVPEEGMTIGITPEDKGFVSDGCGTWVRIGDL